MKPNPQTIPHSVKGSIGNSFFHISGNFWNLKEQLEGHSTRSCAVRSKALVACSRLLANDIVMTFLGANLALQFDLTRNPIVDKPIPARVDIGIEPSSLVAFYQMYSGEDMSRKVQKIEGMIQINAITAKPLDGPVPPHLMEKWHQSRKDHDVRGLASSPIALIELVMGDSTETVIAPATISPAAIEIARDAKPFPFKSVLKGCGELPFNALSCIE